MVRKNNLDFWCRGFSKKIIFLDLIEYKNFVIHPSNKIVVKKILFLNFAVDSFCHGHYIYTLCSTEILLPANQPWNVAANDDRGSDNVFKWNSEMLDGRFNKNYCEYAKYEF